jgi:hypothetical protein
MRLSRRAAAGLSPALQGDGGVPQVMVAGAGMERGGGLPGRTSTVRMTLWQPDLEVGAASRSDLAGGGGGGSFGRHGIAGRRVASCGIKRWYGWWSFLPPSPRWCLWCLVAFLAVRHVVSPAATLSIGGRGRAAAGVGGLFGRMWGGVLAATSSGGRAAEGAAASEEVCRMAGRGGRRWRAAASRPLWRCLRMKIQFRS